MNDPVAWFVLALITVVSFVFGIYTWIAGKERKQFSASRKTNEIISAGKENINKLEIRYGNLDITDFSCTWFYIWNSGSKVLNESDVVDGCPICVTNTGNAMVLDAKVVRVSEKTNNFAITKATNRKVVVSFDYVECGEGAVLQILHTGDARNLDINCKIKGGNIKKDQSIAKGERSTTDKIVDFVGTVFPLAIGCILFFLTRSCLTEITIGANHKWLLANLSEFVAVVILALGIDVGNRIVRFIKRKTYRDVPYSLTE